MRVRACLAALLAAALAAPSLMADARTWRLDPTHSRVVFDVEHAGFSYALATLSRPTGTLRFDPDGWADAHVAVEIPMATLDFGDADWNETMLGRRWFDVERFPVARFVSERVEGISEDEARVFGTLTVRDVSAPVVLELRRNAVKRNPLTLRRTAGFSATATLDRNDFGLDRNANLIGRTVRVRIEVEALRARARQEENDDADPQRR